MVKRKISIVTPNYNGGEYIEQTIDSILSQGYDDLDYIIVDGASTDNSIEIIKKYEKYLTCWISEPDSGQTDAINKGLKLCTGEIFNWINSDDSLCPNSLDKINSAFAGDIDVLVGSTNIIKEGKVVRILAPTQFFEYDIAKTIAIARLNQPGQWWRKSIFCQLEYLNDSFRYVMDLEFWIRYIMNYGVERIAKQNSSLANFRIHSQSKTVSEDIPFKLERNNLYRAIFKLYFESNEYKKVFEIDSSELAASKLVNLYNFPTESSPYTQAILDKFTLLLAEEAYHAFDGAKSKKLLEYITPINLDKEETQLFKKLELRLKIPEFIRVNLQRSIRQIRSI